MVLYLSGAVRREVLEEPGFGFLLTPRMGNRFIKGAIWAADTGCFSQPQDFHLAKYLRWLDSKCCGPRADCLFVNAPDVLEDHAATLERALPVLPQLRAAGWKASFVAQNGATIDNVPWDELDGIFIGGDSEWKESRAAASLIHEGRRRGKHTHVGRVNAPERLMYAARAGAHSVDGTRIAFGFNENWPLLREWVRCLRGQQSFSFLAD